MTDEGAKLIAGATFDLIGRNLGGDVRRSIQAGLRAGAVLDGGPGARSVFRSALASALVDRRQVLEKLLRPFLATGTADPTNTVFERSVRFAVARPIAAIQGCLAELLAIAPVCALVDELRRNRQLPDSIAVHVGDTIRLGGRKAGDMHLLQVAGDRSVQLHGVVEVKAFSCSDHELATQCAKHWARATNGVASVRFRPDDRAQVRMRACRSPSFIAVTASSARLPREYKILLAEGRTFVDLPAPTTQQAAVDKCAEGHWRIRLGWSGESLRAAAHDVLLWYVGQLGNAIIENGGKNPWPEGSNWEAGRNAIKMALYYSLDGHLSRDDYAKAVALYNSLSFGYALGSAYRASDGAPAMLWYEDLQEIAAAGVTRDGGYLRR